MSHKKLRPCIVKVSVLGYFPLYFHTPCGNPYFALPCLNMLTYECHTNVLPVL